MSVLRRFSGALLLILVALTTTGFATGRLASVVTNGVSMQPSHAAGDLVLVARSDRYRVGDIVAYRDDDRGEVVLHRIVGGDADGFELRGDNNESIDVARPRAGEIIGRQALHVPKVGRWIGSPLMLAMSAGVLIGLAAVLTVTGTARPSSRRDDEVPPPGAPGSKDSTIGRLTRRWRWWHVPIVLADLAAISGLLVAWLAPPTLIEPPPVPMHVGALSYASDVAGSDTYPSGRVQTGDSVFMRVVDHTDVTFHYTGVHGMSANVRLRAVIEAAAGWTTTVPLSPLTPVIDGRADLHGTIDLVSLRALLTRVQATTGITLTTVQLRVEAIVEPDASADVAPFRQEMVFRFDELGLDLAEATTVTPSPDGPVVALTEPMTDTVPEPVEVGGVPREARRWLLVAVLMLMALTASTWPSGERRKGRSPQTDEHPVPVTVVAEVSLPDDRMRVRLAVRSDLERIAREAEVPMLVRADGWCAVVTDRAVHWWAPQVEASEPVGPAGAVPDDIATSPASDDRWAVEPPRFAEAPIDPRTAPTLELRLDALDVVSRALDAPAMDPAETDSLQRLQDEVFAPRRPLFDDRRAAVPVTAPLVEADALRTATPDRQLPVDPLRSTIDEIVAYLAEAAPRPEQRLAPRPQEGARDLAS